MNGSATDDYPPADLRVSDADRDRAVSELTTAFEAGRLTAEEFDQRSSQALEARTGKELAALFTDLKGERALAKPVGGLSRTQRVVAARIAAGGFAVSAVSLAGVAISNGVASASNLGPSLAVREAKRALAQQILTNEGISIKVPLPPPQGFDWAGTITPAVIAVVLIALTIVFLRLARSARA
jgi:hypothetical protein